MFSLSCIINWIFLGKHALIICLVYLLINILYSFKLKCYPIVDVALLALGYLIRVIYGSIITSIMISNWLYLFIIAASFYFGYGKRRNELKSMETETREVNRKYTYSFLDKNMYICMALALTFYSFWTIDKNTIGSIEMTPLIWSVPIVMIIFMDYSFCVEISDEGDPVEVLTQNPSLIVLSLIYALIMYLLLYVFV